MCTNTYMLMLVNATRTFYNIFTTFTKSCTLDQMLHGSDSDRSLHGHGTYIDYILSYIVSLLIFAHSTVLHSVFSVLFNSKKCKQFAASCCMVDVSCGLSGSLHELFWSNCNESAQCNYTPQRISLCWTC